MIEKDSSSLVWGVTVSDNNTASAGTDGGDTLTSTGGA